MAKDRNADPRRLDVYAFATAAARVEGERQQREFLRLSQSLIAVPGDLLPPPVTWAATGEGRPVAGAAPETWLHLEARSAVTLQCQRCLQPMTEPLAINRAFRFVGNEDEAARLDEDSEDDVLVASRSFDLQELLEDELILALPLVPRHETCPQPLAMSAGDEEAEEPAPNPFAALAALRRPPDKG